MVVLMSLKWFIFYFLLFLSIVTVLNYINNCYFVGKYYFAQTFSRRKNTTPSDHRAKKHREMMFDMRSWSCESECGDSCLGPGIYLNS